MQVNGSVALITGGASGLGDATARLLAKAGAKIVILDLNEERGTALATELEDRAIFSLTDITDKNDVKETIEKGMLNGETIRLDGGLRMAAK